MSDATSRAHRGAKLNLKSVALPVEHGGWGMLGEPLLLALLVAPSWAGAWASRLSGPSSPIIRCGWFSRTGAGGPRIRAPQRHGVSPSSTERQPRSAHPLRGECRLGGGRAVLTL
jgi:hypothetical protein